MAETIGRFRAVIALGMIFSIHVWSIALLATVWPKERLIAGGNRCIIRGKKPSMLEKS